MFKLPEEVKKGLKDYKRSLEDLQAGKLLAARFKGIRVPWGIYSHRGGKVFMARIRIPASLLNASQLNALASASQKYGSGVLHITTRQDIQIHGVRIEDTIKVMEYLKGHNLSTRGGGGNTVRNVISCSLSGVCKDEIFDVRKGAVAITEHLLRQETSFNLPRKFKIAFSGCNKDCTGCMINDLGFLAREKNGKKGFKVFVGGGMGASSRVGNLLEEFIPIEDMGYCVAAVKNIFFKKGNRRNKHHSRLRFLIEDTGLEEFKKLYKKEFQEVKEKEYIALRKIDFPEGEAPDSKIPESGDKEYNEFLKYSVLEQKQKGFVAVNLRVPRGDISAEKVKTLAGLEKEFPGMQFRTSQNQNIFMVWVKKGDARNLFLKLKSTLDEFLYPNTLLDVVTCKGAVTCNLGLCNAPALAKEMEGVIKDGFIGSKAFKGLEIKLNGCPNACGHQPIGKISFYGLVRRVDNRPVPFYHFVVGGRKEADKTQIGKEIGIIPARNIPRFLKEFLKRVEGTIREGVDIYELLKKDAVKIAQELLGGHSYVPSYSEERDFYIDWGRYDDFSLAGIGPGECGAGVLDMIESDLAESKIALDEAEKEDYSPKGIRKSLFLSARALLVVKGCDPTTEEETLSDFEEKFIKEGIASNSYADIKNTCDSIVESLRQEERKGKFQYAKDFHGHINTLYRGMDSSFNFPREKPQAEENEKTSVLNLKGTPCPLNYVKAKLYLENLDSGDIIEILLDEGEPMRNVPSSLKNDGHQVLNIEKQDGFYKVLVKKR